MNVFFCAFILFPLRFCANNRFPIRGVRAGRGVPSQPRSLFFRRLKSFADRHSQLCSSRNIQKPSTFLAKSFIDGRTDSSEEDEEEEVEDRSGVRGGERREVPLCKDRGTRWERRVCSSPAPNW